MTYFQLKVAYGLDPGIKRSQNEDAVGYHQPDTWDNFTRYGSLFVVADGVGGLSAGMLASDMTVRQVIEEYYSATSVVSISTRLNKILGQINSKIHETYNSSATTVVVGVIRGNELVIAHVGDSRAYLIQNNHVTQLTEDHVHPVLQKDGRTKNKLLQALGYKDKVNIDIQQFSITPNSYIILMTDGATRYINHSSLLNLCKKYVSSEQLVSGIIDYSNMSGGVDNIGVIVVKVADPIDSEEGFESAKAAQTSNEIRNDYPEVIELPPLKASSHQKSRKKWPVLLLLVLIISIGGYVILFHSQTGSIEGSNLVVNATSPTDLSRIQTTVTNMAILTLDKGIFIEVEKSAPTYARIDDDVIAFMLDPEHTVEIIDIYQTNEGTHWYRLFDERNKVYGWIEEANLPIYHIVP